MLCKLRKVQKPTSGSLIPISREPSPPFYTVPQSAVDGLCAKSVGRAG